MDNIIFFISVFLAGTLSFFSPCILPLLPVYGGILLYDKDGAQASSGKFSISVVSLLRTQAFIAGISFFASSSSLQLCFETFPKTSSLPRNPQKSRWFAHYRDGNLGAFGKCFHFDYII